MKYSQRARLSMSRSLPRKWLDKATEDLEVARLIRKESHFAHSCLLSQQCIEKALKAYLIHKTNTHPYIHNLVDPFPSRCRHKPHLPSRWASAFHILLSASSPPPHS